MTSMFERHDIQQVLRRQTGVISRRQLGRGSATDNDLRRMVRRRELARVLPGVYVNHTGPTSWHQRAWAGVLYYWPAALWGDSAMQSILGRRWRRSSDAPIQIAIDVSRTLVAHPGFRLERTPHLADRTRWYARPPHLLVEHALLMLATSNPTSEAIAILADACQARCTSPADLLEHAARIQRLPGRAWLTGMLTDLAGGSASALELAYLRGVERAHRLPTPDRQVPAQAGQKRVRRDVLHRPHGLAVELDGRAFHDHARARDADLDRDLAAAVDGLRTVRLGWAQVVGRPCQTAAMIAVLLSQGGWPGSPRPCSPGCEVTPVSTLIAGTG